MEAYPFAHGQRVRFGETDMHRVAYLRRLGIQYDRDFIARGIDFTIGEASVKYRAPLRFDDEFDIKVRVGDIRHSSWTFEYAIDRADGLHCADVSTVHVVIGPDLGAQRMPGALKTTLARAKGDSNGP